jgi:MFS family permease
MASQNSSAFSDSKLLSSPLYAWCIWLLSSTFMFYKYAIEVSPSVMTSHLMRSFNIDATALGNLAACYFYSYLIMQIPAGLLIDRFGPRRVTTLAIALCASGALLFAKADTLLMASIGRFLAGTGAAFAALNCLKIIALWFPSNRFAFMAGLMMTLGMLGAVGGQSPLSAFVDALGWRGAMQVIAAAGLVLALLFWLLVRDRPQEILKLPTDAPKEKLFSSLRQIFKNRQSWWLSIYSGLAFAPVSVFGGLWGVPFIAQAFSMSSTMASHKVSLIFIGFAVGAPIIGWLSDWLGYRCKVMLWGTVVALISLSLVLYAPGLSPWMLSVLMFTFGAAISCFLLCFTLIQEIHPPVLAATAVGFMNAFDALFGALSDPLTGKFLDMGWKGDFVDGARLFPTEIYKIALSTLPIYLVLASVLVFLIRETYCKRVAIKGT